MVLTLMITSTIVACNLIRDKEEGTLKRFNISPRNRFEYILGVYLYNLLFTFVQISIAIILVSLLPMSIGINTGDFFILGAVISFIASSFGLLIACLSNEELKASLVSSSVAMILALFGGAFIPIGKMPDALQRLSNGSIVKWLIEFTKSAKNGFVSSGDWIPIIIISLMALAGILLSIKTSRRKFA
jgi:ABC-2 type transport system permease protein